jgi:hypothetical protein
MTVTAADLGAAVCRALMRELADRSVRLDLWVGYPKGATAAAHVAAHGPEVAYRYEYTPAGERRVADQWTVVLLPTPAFVTVRATGRYWGFGVWDDLDIGAANDLTPTGDYVRYPAGHEDDPSLVTGDGYVGRLRAAIERALAVVERDHARARVGTSGETEADREAGEGFQLVGHDTGEVSR